MNRAVSSTFLLAVAILLQPAAVWAANVTVGCPGGTAGMFTSITDALNALPFNSPSEFDIITVTGTCTENLFISRRQGLIIEAPVGQTAIVNSADPAGIVVHIFQSRAIVLSRLVIQGGQRGVLVNNGSDVIIEGSTIQDNLGVAGDAGVEVQIASVLSLSSSTIQNNAGAGLVVGGNSEITVGGLLAAEAVRINNNGRQGIVVKNSGFLQSNGNLTVENNASNAILVRGGHILMFGIGNENIFRDNGVIGVNVIDGSLARFVGQNTIQNNGFAGVQVTGGSSAQFRESVLPDGTLRVTVIEGHTSLGVNVGTLSQASFVGHHKIRNNGVSTDSLRGGIRVAGTSLLTVRRGTEISNNGAAGIHVEANADVELTNSTITNNTEEGVRVLRMSTASFRSGNTIFGNGVANVSCDTTSLVFGDLGGITNINCSRIEHELGPPRPGHIIEQ